MLIFGLFPLPKGIHSGISVHAAVRLNVLERRRVNPKHDAAKLIDIWLSTLAYSPP